MKNRFISALLALTICLFTVFLSGCLALSYDTERQGPAMWIVEDKDGHRCYLFGTVHVGKTAMRFRCATL